MIKAILIYLILSISFGLLLTVFNKSTGEEKVTAVRTIGFGAACGALALFVLFIVVQLF